jgi:hypothetical protein
MVILNKMTGVIKGQSEGSRHRSDDRVLYARQDDNPMAKSTGRCNAVIAIDCPHLYRGWALSFFLPRMI